MKKKILYAVTVPKSLKLLSGKIEYLNNNGFDTQVITSEGEEASDYLKETSEKLILVNMQREINLFQDTISLFKLIKVIYLEKPDIINAGTPKAGLLVSVAAFICRVPIRIYTIRGLRLETTKGIKKKILLITEKVAAISATHIISISPSLKEKVIELRITSSEKIRVIGKGSSNGINVEKFCEKKNSIIEKETLMKKLNIRNTDFVLGFVGRLTNDKGIAQLLEIFEQISNNRNNVKLLILGEFEDNDSVSIEIKEKLLNNPQIILEGFKKNVVPYYFVMHLFVFLSKREGFGNVVIEAALASVPAVVGNVTGVKDTVIDNKTGYVIDLDDAQSCISKIEYLMDNESKRIQMGINAEIWAYENFNSKIIWKEYLKMYKNLLESSR